MSNSAASCRPSRARLAGALFAIAVLAAGCGDAGNSGDSGQGDSSTSSESSDQGGASGGNGASDDGGDVVVTGSSDGGGKTSATVPQDPFPVTPAPDGFVPPEPCTGEGAYFVEVGGAATPDLPERDGETLSIEATAISGDDAQLTATLGGGKPRPIEDITLGETAALEGWTISVTSVCTDTDQIEFDLIN